MSESCTLAIIIPTCRRERLLRRTLESVASARLPPELREVRVVENGGSGEARKVCADFSDRLPVRYSFQVEGNKSRALNGSVREAAADLISFLDDDVRVSPGLFETYLDAASRCGLHHHFSGPLVPEWEKEPPEWLKPYLPPSTRGWYHGDEERYYDLPHFIGSNWAAFRDDILGVGGFAEHLGPGSPTGAIGDEMELQRRLLDAGGRGVYLPGARIYHHVPRAACDFDWARRRQHRMGLTYGLLGWPEDGAASAEDGGAWRLVLLAGKVAVARALGWSEERRAYLEMTYCRMRGYRKGRHLSRTSVGR